MSTSQFSEPGETAAPASSRRNLLLGAGLLAAAAGATLAWRQSRHDSPPKTATQPPQGFWEQAWDTPQGDARLQLQSYRGQRLLINFWATWCAPCVEELPLLNDFFAKNNADGWHVLGLAIDKPTAVQNFFKHMPLRYPVGMAGATGSALMEQLGNPAGALPFSVVLGGEGLVLGHKLGQLTLGDLGVWAQLK